MNKERIILSNFCKSIIAHFKELSIESNVIVSASEIEWEKASLAGIRMAVVDFVEWVSGLSEEHISSFDNKLQSAGLPTVTAMKNKNYRETIKILNRGFIKTDNDFYLLKSFITNGDSKDLTSEQLKNAE